jgi:hypothetical protein
MTHEFDSGGLLPSTGLHVGHAERIFAIAGTPVPDAELARFKRSMTERVVKPMQDRAVAQCEQGARVRSRQVR